MEKREKLNQLVVATLGDSPLKATQIYYTIKEHNPMLLKHETRGFHSFVLILRSFSNIERMGSGVKLYKAKM